MKFFSPCIDYPIKKNATIIHRPILFRTSVKLLIGNKAFSPIMKKCWSQYDPSSKCFQSSDAYIIFSLSWIKQLERGRRINIMSYLVWQLKHIFSVFKQHYTYFYTFFHTKHMFLSAYTNHPISTNFTSQKCPQYSEQTLNFFSLW